MTLMSLAKRDFDNIWHPFTQMKTAPLSTPIVKGEGSWLYDDQGKAYLDGISSWWVNLHGHGHPYIAEQVAEQFKTLEHVIFAGFTHPPAVQLSEQLLQRLPGSQDKVFFSDNGSTAVEVGLKMAIQYWYNQGWKQKRKILAFNNSYHGDTFGAMAVSERDAFTAPFHPHLFEVTYIDPPLPGHEEASLQQLKTALSAADDYAGFIFEPLVQGVGGMAMYRPEALDPLITLCRDHELITIADEVMTGFGRTGTYFASDQLNEKPDVMCLSKGLTGGTMAMGITTCPQAIYDAFYADDKMQTFFHGHSFTANPVACAAALASWELLQQHATWQQIQQITEKHEAFIRYIKDHPNVKAARQTGTILALELGGQEATSYFSKITDQLKPFFMEQGLLIRPLGNTLYLMPPYCITADELDQLYQGVEAGLAYLDQAEKPQSV